MRKLLSIFTLALAFVAGAALSAQLRDRHDLEACHNPGHAANQAMEPARSANNSARAGHGAKAEGPLRAAEHELSLAIDGAKK